MEETIGVYGRRKVLVILLALPLLGFGIDFVTLVVSYQALAWLVPDALGQAAASPARFAVLITLLKVPMAYPIMLAVTRRAWMAGLRTGRVPDPLVRHGWRRIATKIRDYGIDGLCVTLAALFVCTYVDDPGADVRLLVALTVVVPRLLFELAVTLPFRLLNRWLRRQRACPTRHATPDDDQPPELEQRGAPAVRATGE